MDPLDIFKLVGDPNYEVVYRQFLERQFGPNLLADIPNEAAETEPFGISEDDLYPNERHANVHRELQLLLDANNKESKAIATMIHLAAQQLDEEGNEKPQEEPPAEPESPSRVKRRK